MMVSITLTLVGDPANEEANLLCDILGWHQWRWRYWGRRLVGRRKRPSALLAVDQCRQQPSACLDALGVWGSHYVGLEL